MSTFVLLYTFVHFVHFCTFVLLYLVIWLDSPYELLCKIWSLQLKKLALLYLCTFVLLYFYTFVVLYFCTLSFGQTVHMNFHAKSGVYSSKNERVMFETRAFSTGPVENACIKLLKPLNLEVIVLQCEFLTSYPKVSLAF